MASVSWSPATSGSVFQSRTVSQFRLALGLAVMAALVGCAIYWLEKQAIPYGNRFARNPVELMVRCLGLAHFIVGWIFLLTSRRLRQPTALVRLGLGFAAGVTLCLLFAQLGALRNPYLYLFFYSFFLFHEIRDESVIYQNLEGIKPNNTVDAFTLAAAIFFLFLLAVGYALFQTLIAREPCPVSGLWLISAALGVVCILLGRRFRKHTNAEGNTFLRDHRPLLVVYAMLLIVLIVSAPLGSIGFVVLLHVASWLVFVRQRLVATGTGATDWWPWFRSTPNGFLVLHLGLAGVLFGLMVVRVHLWHRVGLMCDVLAEGSFCYWALMHICMSFWSSR
jgi:hypothetical protein